MVDGWFIMGIVGIIEAGLRRSRCSKDLALALMQVTMIAYWNEVEAMGKTSKKAAKHTTAAAKEETPAEAFHRLAQGRTNKAVKSISLIGQLTGSAYESTDVQRRAIVAALQVAVDFVKDTFEGKAKASDKFRLPSG